MRRPRLLLVDDRPYTLDAVTQAFSARGWRVRHEPSLVGGVTALLTDHLAAAVFDRHLPRPAAAERLELENYGVPRTWVDALDDFDLGSVLGRIILSRNLHIPYVYISALDREPNRPPDWPADSAAVFDKMSVDREETLGDEVLAAITQLVGLGESSS